MKTYLQLINLVLDELREDSVTSVTGDTHVELIGRFVNKAKTRVEDAHDWSALLTSYAIATSASDGLYSLTGSANRFKEDFMVNDATGCIVPKADRRYVKLRLKHPSPPESTPQYWTFDGVDANGDAQVRFLWTPDGTHNFTLYGWQKDADLSANDDECNIPHEPIVQLATAYAVRERGETGGTNTAEHFEMAKRTLADAVAYDAALNDVEDDWYV